MPFLMQLQGPSPSRFRTLRFPRRQFQGVGSAIMLNPIVFLGGLIVGGYFAYHRIKPSSLLRGRRNKRL